MKRRTGKAAATQPAARPVDGPSPGVNNKSDAYVLLPPLLYDGKLLKGILAGSAIDALVLQFPATKTLFNFFAYTHDNQLPVSQHADGLLLGRMAPEPSPPHTKQVPVRLGTADLFDHYDYCPTDTERDIDVLCVAALSPEQNLQMFAEAVKVLQTRRSGNPLRIVLYTGAQIDINWSQLTEQQTQVVRAFTLAFDGLPQDFLRIEPDASYLKLLYRRAKVCVSPAVTDIDARAFNEAMACDTPVVTFGEVLTKAGMQVPQFDAQSLAETISTALTKRAKYSPREAIMAVSGRKAVLYACMDALPYYARELSGYVVGHHLNNAWIDVAMYATYNSDMHTYLFKGGAPGFYAPTQQRALLIVRDICERLGRTSRRR